MKKLDLDVHSPGFVSPVLREAARVFYESAGELESTWQDRSAGRPWAEIAAILDHAADKIDARLKRIGW